LGALLLLLGTVGFGGRAVEMESGGGETHLL